MQIFSILSASLIASMVGLVQTVATTSVVLPKQVSYGKKLTLCYNRFSTGDISLRNNCDGTKFATVFSDSTTVDTKKVATTEVQMTTAGVTTKLGWDRKNGQLVAKNGKETLIDLVKPEDLKLVCIRRVPKGVAYQVFRAVGKKCMKENMTLFALDTVLKIQ